MNIFRSESAPFAVVILAGALGWYISTLNETLGDRLSLLYDFRTDREGLLTLRVDNISREQIFSGDFSIVCVPPDGGASCVDTTRDPIAQYRIVDPFNLSGETDLDTSPNGNVIRVSAWIPPSASIEIEFAPNHSKSEYRFQYLPEQSANADNMPEFHVAGVESYLIRNFDSVLVWVFLASFVTLVLYAIVQLWQVFFKKEEESAESPQLHDVTVRHHFDDDSATGDVAGKES